MGEDVYAFAAPREEGEYYITRELLMDVLCVRLMKRCEIVLREKKIYI